MKNLLAIFTLLLFAACSNAAFDGQTSGGEECDGVLESEKCLDAPSKGVQSTVYPISMKTRKEIPLVKTVLIVDNSNSMAEEQALLADGVATFANQLKGKNVDLYLYTTSQLSADAGRRYNSNRWEFYWANLINSTTGSLINHNFSENAMTAMKPISDVVIDWSYTDSSNNVVHASSDPGFTVAPVRDMTFEYPIRPNLLENGSALSIRQNMTDQQISAAIEKLKTSVANVGITGDDSEEGLCSLVRLVYEQGQNKIFGQGDSVAFVILTDEDDRSDLKSCIPSQKLTNIKKYVAGGKYQNCSGGVCTPTRFRYHMRLDHNKLRYECSQSFDGIVKPVAAAYLDLWSCAQSGHCQATAGATCTAEQLALVKSKVGPNSICASTIRSCTVDVPTKPEAQAYETYRDILISSMPTNATFDQYCAKTLEIIRGDTPNGIYYPNTCRFGHAWAYSGTATVIDNTSNGIKPELTYFTDEQKNATTNDKGVLINAFMNKAKALFGDSGFMVSAIMRDQAADVGHTCPTETNANYAYGVAYKQLVTQLGEKGVVHSICATDYGPALKKVEDYIKLVAESTYTMSLKPGEKIAKVTRIRDGKKLVLKIGSDIKISGPKIEFLRDYDVDDKYEVQVESDG